MNKHSLVTSKGDYRLSRSMGVWILLVSLLVNCFLLGLVTAPVFRSPGPPPFMGSPGDMAEHLTHGLSPVDATIMRDAFQKEEPIFDHSRLNMDKAMLEMITVLQQPTVDPQDLEKAQNDISSAHGKLDEAMYYLIKQAATKLSLEGRHRFATSILPPPGMLLPPPSMPMHPPRPGMDHPIFRDDRRDKPND